MRLSTLLSLVAFNVSCSGVEHVTHSPQAASTSDEDLGLYVAGSKCMITQSQCARYPESAGTFEDGYFNSTGGQDPAALSGLNGEYCRQRAVDYSMWCGNPVGVPTTSRYVVPGKRASMIKTFTSGNGCLITVKNSATPNRKALCPRTMQEYVDLQDTWGYAWSPVGQSDITASYCQQRATDYLNWCGLGRVSGSSVTAKFLQGGSVAQEFKAEAIPPQ